MKVKILRNVLKIILVILLVFCIKELVDTRNSIQDELKKIEIQANEDIESFFDMQYLEIDFRESQKQLYNARKKVIFQYGKYIILYVILIGIIGFIIILL